MLWRLVEVEGKVYVQEWGSTLKTASSGVGILLLISLLSMSGLPPFGGFVVKWSILADLSNYLESSSMLVVGGFVVVCGLLGIVNYMRWVKQVYDSSSS